MRFEQWEKILRAVNEQGDLNQDNVIEKMKEELREADPEEYKKWEEEAKFDLNHLFEVEDEGEVHECELLFMAVQLKCEKILNLLVKKGASTDIKAIKGFSILHAAAASGI